MSSSSAHEVVYAGPGKGRFLDYKVRAGGWVSKGSVVARAEDADAKVVKIKATADGTVVKLTRKKGDEIEPAAVVATLSAECPHTTLMKDLCAQCGKDLRKIAEEEKRKAEQGGGGGGGGEAGGDGGGAKRAKAANISMVHSIPELKVSSEEAQNLGREDEMRLQKHRKLVLLVDLDQTLIHTTHENVRNNIKDVYHFQLSGPKSHWNHTRIRPHTAKFLESISKLFELHIVTFGERMYAHTIAGFLDPKSKFFSHRILSRNECFDSRFKTANLSSLFPCGDHMVCIIDDREDVWNFAPNVIHVKQYTFFKGTGDINAPPGAADAKKSAPVSPKVPQAKAEESSDKDGKKKVSSVNDDLELSDEDMDNSHSDSETKGSNKTDKKAEKSDEPGESSDDTKKEEVADSTKEEEKKEASDESSVPVSSDEKAEDDLIEVEDTDDYLIYLEDILKTIHKAYYDLLDQMKEEGKSDIPDLKTVIPYVKRKVLQGANIVFSGIVPMKEPIRKSRAYMVAKSLGANVQNDVTTGSPNSDENTVSIRIMHSSVAHILCLNVRVHTIRVQLT